MSCEQVHQAATNHISSPVVGIQTAKQLLHECHQSTAYFSLVAWRGRCYKKLPRHAGSGSTNTLTALN
jgi:hypothetical protein